MEINLTFNPAELRKTQQREWKVVVIDVLRASSTIVYAFSQGCKVIYPVATIREALKKAEELGGGGVLGGERDGVRIKGFHLGNSPQEYSSQVVRNKAVVFTTTNCTRNLSALKGPKEVIICAFLNLPAVVDYLLQAGGKILIALSGTDGEMSLEDAVCAGMLIERLMKGQDVSLTDSVRCAHTVYRYYKKDILQALLDSRHGKRLQEIGFREDIRFCAKVGGYKIIPRFTKGRLICSG
ncbi:MAG: 2-phosphosulfolactate phosphatase [Candidatus Brocadiales bacterium]|nr:2-phosphosulfolactate phosphatase [Candidatus Brocadiales bacterium]